MAKKSTSTRDLIITAGSLIFVIAVVLLFIPIAMTPTTTTPTMGVPAEFGDTSVEEMIVQPQPQPITTFCKIYPDASTCR